MACFSLALTGCGKQIAYVYVTDIPHMVCAQKKIVDKEHLVFEHVEDLPLVAGGPCDGSVAVSRADYLPFKRWLVDRIQEWKTCTGQVTEHFVEDK